MTRLVGRLYWGRPRRWFGEDRDAGMFFGAGHPDRRVAGWWFRRIWLTPLWWRRDTL